MFLEKFSCFEGRNTKIQERFSRLEGLNPMLPRYYSHIQKQAFVAYIEYLLCISSYTCTPINGYHDTIRPFNIEFC